MLSFVSKVKLAFTQEVNWDGLMASYKRDGRFNRLLTVILGGLGGITIQFESQYSKFWQLGELDDMLSGYSS